MEDGQIRLMNAPQYGRAKDTLQHYIIGHVEPLIDAEHEWLTKDTNIQDIIDDIRESGSDDDDNDGGPPLGRHNRN